MAMEDDSIAWFSPDPRAIIPLEDFHVPHALRRASRKKIFEIKIDNRFGEVIRACAKRNDTWINPEIVESYERLHELGYAHSVEAWSKNKLAGGLYGVAVGGAFFGEYIPNGNASPVASVLVPKNPSRTPGASKKPSPNITSVTACAMNTVFNFIACLLS